MPVAEYELYKRIKLLGEGSFGKAYLVESVADGSLCVIKQVDLSKMSEQEKKDTLKEAKILEALRHPNIVKFREVYKTKKGKLCIVMDYADGGDLAGKVKERRGQYFQESQILDWFTQLCLSMKHVHDRKIIHRDLKCQNIFLTKTNTIKLGDFGIARVLTNTRENAKTMVGTPYYLSPEIIENKPYSFKSDMWSLGVVLYELCALKPPFNADSLHFLALKIVRGSYNPVPSHFSKDLKNLVGLLLQTDPNKRPTTNNILAMPFIQARIKNFLTESIRVTEFSHTVLHKQKISISGVKLEDVKNVINEAPMPQQMFKQLQDKERQQQQQQMQQNIISKENNIQPQANILGANQKPPLVQPKPVVSPADSKQEIIQKIMARREEEKKAQDLILQQQQAVAKQNYHFQAQQSPANLNRRPTSEQRGQVPISGQQQINSDNQGPKIIKHLAEAKPEEPKAAKVFPWDIPQKKPDPYINLNNQKWEKKQLPQQAQQPQLQIQPSQKEFRRDQGVPKSPLDLKPKPQPEPNAFKRVAERDILMGGGGGAFGAFANPNFAANKNKKEAPREVLPKKKNEYESNKKNVPMAKPQIMKENQKNEVLQKIAENNAKKQEMERLRKEKKDGEESLRREEAEKKRVEREKEREALRHQMKADIQKKKNNIKNQGGDFKVEFCSPSYSMSDESTQQYSTAETERMENVSNPKPDDIEIPKPKNVKHHSQPKSGSPEKQRKMKWNIEVGKNREADSEIKREKGILYEDPDEKTDDSNKKDKFKVEIYMPSRPNPTIKKSQSEGVAVAQASKDPWGDLVEGNKEIDKVLEAKGDVEAVGEFEKIEECKGELSNVEKIKRELAILDINGKVDENGVNTKLDEEILSYEALLKELNDLIEHPAEVLNTGEQQPEILSKSSNSSMPENDEDREDDVDDELSKEGSPEKKNTKKATIPKPEELQMEAISDYSKLENLKIFMEDVLGDEVFLKAYRILKDLFHKNANLEEIEQKYAKEDSYAELFPFMAKELRERYLPMMFTFVIFEDIADYATMKNNQIPAK